MIGVLVSKKFGTLRDFQEYYSSRDMYDMLEILVVDAHNEALIAKATRG